VCLSVRDHIFGTTRPIFTKIFMRVTHGRASVLRCQRSDTSCNSGIMGDVIFALKPSLLTRSLGLGYKLCAVIPVVGKRTHGTTFRALKVASQVATPGRSLRPMTALLSLQ